MQNKVSVKLYMRNGEVIDCYYSTRLKSYIGILKEMYNTQHFTGFIRKNTTKKGVMFIIMREVVAVEVYDI